MAPRNVVVTGSTRGIGYGLAEAFLRLGCAVTVGGLRPGMVATDLLRDRY